LPGKQTIYQDLPPDASHSFLLECCAIDILSGLMLQVASQNHRAILSQGTGIMLNKDFEILEILERDARISPEDVAAMLGADPAEVRKRIADLEANGTILGYKAIVNQERVHTDRISCVIEVCVTPERGYGFDRVAERIYRFPEVRAVYLMSGSYDLLVIIEGKTMKEIAQFVIDKLATLENVRGTATRFMLKKYKELGVLLEGEEKVHRMPVTP